MAWLFQQGANGVWRVLTPEVLLALLIYHAVIGKLLPWQVLCGCSAGSQQPTPTSDHSRTHSAALGLPQAQLCSGFWVLPEESFSYISWRLGEYKIASKAVWV